MNTRLSRSFLLRRGGVPLAAAVCLALGLASSPAGAEQCARGQIYWKSKKSCVDKAEAAKLGFFHGRVPAEQKTQGKAVDKPASDNPQPDAAAQDAPEPAIAPPPAAAAAPAEAAPSKPSPYGELVIEEFARAK
jgi:hypothetical protein